MSGSGSPVETVCPFCGGVHNEPPRGSLFGAPMQACPNMPDNWVMVGPDAEDGMIVIDITDGLDER